jgi:hypothetical protein
MKCLKKVLAWWAVPHMTRHTTARSAPLLAAQRSLAAQDPNIVASLLALDRKTFVDLTKLPF